jgi:hypothetical protein
LSAPASDLLVLLHDLRQNSPLDEIGTETELARPLEPLQERDELLVARREQVVDDGVIRPQDGAEAERKDGRMRECVLEHIGVPQQVTALCPQRASADRTDDRGELAVLEQPHASVADALAARRAPPGPGDPVDVQVAGAVARIRRGLRR